MPGFSYQGLETAREHGVAALITLTWEKNTLKSAAAILFLFAFVF